MTDPIVALYIGPILHARFVILWVLFAVVAVGLSLAFVGAEQSHAESKTSGEPGEDEPSRR